MLSVHCPRHDCEVLLGNNRIRGIEPVGGQLTVRWECYCGYRGAHEARSPGRPVDESTPAGTARGRALVSPGAVGAARGS